MVKQIQHLNREVQTLNGAINDTTTSVTVTDGTVFPADGDFYIAIDNELMLVTSRATHVLTVVRGVEGTGGQDHATGAYVFPLASQEALNQWVEEAMGIGHREWYTPHRIVDTNGNALTSSDFTQGNWDLSTVTDNTWGGITIFADVDASSLELRTLYRTAPATPYRVTAHIQTCAGSGSGVAATTTMAGIAFRDGAGTGEMEVYGIRAESNFNHWNFTDWTAFSASVGALGGMYHRKDGWLRMEDDGTNLTSWASVNGLNWAQMTQVGRTSFLTNAPNQICFWVHNGLASGPKRPGTLLAWYEELL
jgi:hypothetical protein